MNDYGPSDVPMPEFPRAVALGDEAIRLLLSAGMPPERLANLAGKAIDRNVRALKEEKRVAKAKAAKKAAIKETALGKLVAREAKRKRRRRA